MKSAPELLIATVQAVEVSKMVSGGSYLSNIVAGMIKYKGNLSYPGSLLIQTKTNKQKNHLRS